MGEKKLRGVEDADLVDGVAIGGVRLGPVLKNVDLSMFGLDMS